VLRPKQDPALFSGIHPVLQLPLSSEHDPNDIDLASLAALTNKMIDSGAAGLVVHGLATESWTLTDIERDEILGVVITTVNGRVPVTVGIDGSTSQATAQARAAAAMGCGGLLVRPPGGVPSIAALGLHLNTVADAAGIPMVFQDVPQITGLQLSVADLVELCAGHDLIAAVKTEIPGAGPRASAAVEAGLVVIAGWGGLNYLEMVDRGAVGCMPGCDLGPAFVAIDDRFRAGHDQAATDLYRAVLPILAFEISSLDLLVLGAKHILERGGVLSSRHMRAPRRALDQLERQILDQLYDEAAAAGVPGFVAFDAPTSADRSARLGMPTATS